MPFELIKTESMLGSDLRPNWKSKTLILNAKEGGFVTIFLPGVKMGLEIMAGAPAAV